MRRLILLVLSSGLLGLMGNASMPAQQAPPPLPPPVKDEVLAKMVGTWRAAGEMGGQKYVDTVRARWGLNRQFVITDVKTSDANDSKKVLYEGHGLMRYDTDKKQYVMHWFDAYGSMQIFAGELKDNLLTLTSKGAKRTEQLTFTLGKGSYKLSMDVSEGDGPMKREWETTYTKVKPAAVTPGAAAPNQNKP